MLKIHKAVVGSRYFYITNIIIPLVFTLIGILYRSIVGSVSINLMIFIQAWLMLYEVSTEYFGYGPIYRKNNLGMEYLKTSYNGMSLVKKSMLTDSVLRIIRTFFYTPVPGLAVIRSVDDPKVLLLYALAMANVSVWSVNFTRYIALYGYLFMVSSPMVAIGLIIDYLGTLSQGLLIPMIVCTAILLPAGICFTQKYADMKIKASYSDIA